MTRAGSDRALERHEAHRREHGFGLLAAEDKRTAALLGRSIVVAENVASRATSPGLARQRESRLP
jgi:hypothetical protein